MTLSLDDVRNKRFRMARKSGYEVLEVDVFVDEVEVAFEQLTEENQNLKKQIEALQAAPVAEAPAAQVETGPAEPETIVVTTGAEASSAVVRLVALSTEQAERLVNEATDEAAKIREDATSAAQQLTGDAQARAERISTEAQEAADRVQAEAQSRADNLDNEIAGRRSDLLDGLHAERDALQVAVGQLRSFEAGFRANLTNELREHISTLESRNAQPHEVPALADPAAVAAAGQPTGAAAAEDAEPAGAADSAGVADSAGEADSAGDAGAAPDDSAATSAGDTGTTNGSVFPDEDPADGSQDDSASETPRLNALLGDQR